MHSHILVHGATTIFLANSFVFKNATKKEGLSRDSPAGLGAGGPRFKSGRPDQNIARVFYSLLKAPFTENSPVEFRQTGGLDSQIVWFPRVRRMTNFAKTWEAGVLFRNR